MFKKRGLKKMLITKDYLNIVTALRFECQFEALGYRAGEAKARLF